MILAQRFGCDVEGAAHQQLCAAEVAERLQQLGEHAHGAGGLRMVVSPCLLRQYEGSTIDRFGFGKAPSFMQKCGEMKERRADSTVLETEAVLIKKQRAAKKRFTV